ncbi:MAG: acyl-CoA thioesterase [Flavobacteriales bacterium]|nr:acyl-CoA thioesterase [Flavobacteriales bacterium]
MSSDDSLVLDLELPVAWGEQDAFGHLNNVVYFRYFENVRMHFLQRIGVLRSHDEDGIGVILAHTACDFERPVVWPARLRISTGCTAVGNTSFTLTYLIQDEAGNTVATGTSVQVMYDYTHHRKVPVPKAVRQAIKALGST